MTTQQTTPTTRQHIGPPTTEPTTWSAPPSTARIIRRGTRRGTRCDAKEVLYRCILAGDSNPMSCEEYRHRWDAVDTYFGCLVACDLLDQNCSMECVEGSRFCFEEGARGE